MERAIDNKEIGFIDFSKLSSHDWAHRPRLSGPKESSAIEKFPHRSALFPIYLPPALARFALDL